MIDNQLWYILLSVGSICIFVVTLLLLKFDILSPTVAIASSLMISSTLAMTMVNKWNLPMHGSTVLLLLSAQVFMIILSLYANYCYPNNKKINSQFLIKIKIWKLMIVILVMSILLFQSAIEAYNLSLLAGNHEGWRGIISTIRPYIMKEDDHIRFSRWMVYRQLIVQQIAYVFLYALIHNVIIDGWKLRYLPYCIPVITLFPFIYLSTGRILIISLVIFIFTCCGFALQRKYRYQDYIKRMNLVAILAFLGFVVLFVLIGALFGKGVSSNKSVYDILAHYAGISLSAFDTILKYEVVDTHLIGQTLFVGPYNNLISLGVDIPRPSIFLFFTYFDGIDTNVYTALMRYYHDFSIVGMYIFSAIIIIIYTILYLKARNSNGYNLSMAYGTFAYPLYLFYVDDRIFIDFFGTQMIYILILQYILSKALYQIICSKG